MNELRTFSLDALAALEHDDDATLARASSDVSVHDFDFITLDALDVFAFSADDFAAREALNTHIVRNYLDSERAS